MWEDERETILRKGSVVITVSVLPGRSKTQARGVLTDGTVKIEVAAQPEKGKANDKLSEYLADAFSVPVAHVRILSGAHGRKKQIKITL